MAYFRILDAGMFIHHLMCIFGMYLGICEGVSLNYIIDGLYISEISNPVMHIRIISKHLGLRYTKLYEICELLYILLYIYGRILLGTSIVLKTCFCSYNNLLVRVVSVGLAL